MCVSYKTKYDETLQYMDQSYTLVSGVKFQMDVLYRAVWMHSIQPNGSPTTSMVDALGIIKWMAYTQ